MGEPASDNNEIVIEDGINLGTKRPAKLGRWKPRRWDARYEMMVIMDMNGTSQIEISRLFNVSQVNVSMVINSPQAEIVRRRIYAKLSAETQARIPATLESIANKALERLGAALDNDELFARAPLAVADRSIAVLKGVGKLNPDSGGNITAKNAIFLNRSDVQEMKDALAKSDVAKALNSGEIVK